jgi:hypothetical protein
LAVTEGQVLEDHHHSHNRQSHKGALPAAIRERPANDRRTQTACKVLVIPERSKRIPSPGADSR